MKQYFVYALLAAALFSVFLAVVYVYQETKCVPSEDVVRAVGYARCVYPGYAELVAKGSISDVLTAVARRYPYVGIFGYSEFNAILVVHDGNSAYTYFSQGGKTIGYWQGGEGYFVDANVFFTIVEKVRGLFPVRSFDCVATDMRPYVVADLFPKGNVFVYCTFDIARPATSTSALEERRNPCVVMWGALDGIGKLKRAWLDGVEHRAYVDGKYVFVGTCGEDIYKIRGATALPGEQALKILTNSKNTAGP